MRELKFNEAMRDNKQNHPNPTRIMKYGKQVGGSHYETMKISPIEIGMALNLNPCAFNIVKYVSRYKNKNGKEDLLKALQYCDIWENHGFEAVRYHSFSYKTQQLSMLFAQQFLPNTLHTGLMVKIFNFGEVYNEPTTLQRIKSIIQTIIKHEYPEP